MPGFGGWGARVAESGGRTSRFTGVFVGQGESCAKGARRSGDRGVRPVGSPFVREGGRGCLTYWYLFNQG